MHCWPSQIDPPDKIVDYFLVQSCLWTVGQHYTDKFLVQCCVDTGRSDIRLFSCENMSACFWANIAPQVIFLCNVLSDVFEQQ